MLLILSGGLDSTTLLYMWQKDIKKAISFNYNQRHVKELNYAKLHCNKLKIPWQEIHLNLPLTSALMANSQEEIPNGHYQDETMRKTVVPFRNGIMLSIAVGIADNLGIKKVAIASHLGDHAIYPDCRENFIKAFSKASTLGTYTGVEVFAPFSFLSKRSIVTLGREWGVPYEETWSCYKGGERHCGKCGTCVERKEALKGFDLTCYEKEVIN